MRKPKIAIIGVKGLPAFGGSARSAEALIEKLNDDFDFTIYAISSHTDNKGNYGGVKQHVFHALPFKKLNTFFYYFKSTWHALIHANYDLVHVHHVYAGFIIPILKLKYPVLNTVHGVIPANDNKWNWLDKKLFAFFAFAGLRFSDTVISVSAPHIPILKKVIKRDIIYIPNGVEIPAISSNYVQPVEDYIVFAASRIISLKGCHLLLIALNEIKYTGKVKIIGALDHVPDYGNYLRELSKGLNVDFVPLIKEKEELFAIIKSAKLFVFPSLNEGMSNMLLEVAALRTPIIASDIVENKYVFNKDEVTYFRSNDAEDLAEKIEQALSNGEILKTKSVKAFSRVLKNHDWTSLALQYSVLYKSLIK